MLLQSPYIIFFEFLPTNKGSLFANISLLTCPVVLIICFKIVLNNCLS